MVIRHNFYEDLTNAVYVVKKKKGTFKGVGGIRQLLIVSTKKK